MVLDDLYGLGEARELFVNTEYVSPVLNSQVERFTMERFMRFSHDIYDSLTSHFLSAILEMEEYGRVQATSTQGRPELLSYQIYGETQYAHALLIYNGMISALQLKDGMIIRYPRRDDLDDLYFSLRIKEQSRR